MSYRIYWEVFDLALRSSYRLPFTDLSSFKGVLVFLIDEDGKLGLSESVPLPGYGTETLKDDLNALEQNFEKGARFTVKKIYSTAKDLKGSLPFLSSALFTAVESYGYELIPPHRLDHGLVYPFSLKNSPQELLTDIKKAVENGCRYLKGKVGGSPISREKGVLDHLDDKLDRRKIRFRFDANQSYDLGEAKEIVKFLENGFSRFVEWLEQPLNINSLEDHKNLSSNSNVPIVLDEDIYDEYDIEEAGEANMGGVKLKLCKHSGITETIELAKRARSLDLFVVFGNGVATDVGNYLEGAVVSGNEDLFRKGLESNGYRKIKTNLVFGPSKKSFNSEIEEGIQRKIINNQAVLKE